MEFVEFVGFVGSVSMFQICLPCARLWEGAGFQGSSVSRFGFKPLRFAFCVLCFLFRGIRGSWAVFQRFSVSRFQSLGLSLCVLRSVFCVFCFMEFVEFVVRGQGFSVLRFVFCVLCFLFHGIRGIRGSWAVFQCFRSACLAHGCGRGQGFSVLRSVFCVLRSVFCVFCFIEFEEFVVRGQRFSVSFGC